MNDLSKPPLISVLMPVFNGERYIRQAIDSILAQTVTDFELIIIDDASTDNTSSILHSYADRRIRLIRLDANLGIVGALNIGLDAANGEFIARMDADDISHPDRFAKQVAFMKKNLQIGLLGSWIRGFGDVRWKYIERYPENHDEIRTWMIFENPFAHSAIMFRREVIEQNQLRYPDNFRFVEDWALWSLLADKTEFANIQSVLVDYRINKMGISQTGSAIQTRSKSKLMQQNFSKFNLPYDAILATPVQSIADLIRLSDYFFVLENSNYRSNVLVPETLVKCINSIWLRACCRMRENGFSVAKYYVRFPHTHASSIVLAKNFLKILVNSYSRNILDTVTGYIRKIKE